MAEIDPANQQEATKPEDQKPALAEDKPIELMPEPGAADKSTDQNPDPDKPAVGETQTAYLLRKETEKRKAIETDLAAYKRREREAADANKTAEQKRDEELTTLRETNARLEREKTVTEIGIEFKLPRSMWSRIQGADADAMRADAADLAALVKRPTVGNATDPSREANTRGAKIYTRAELAADPKLARSPEVLKAFSEGRVH